jgi:cell division septum initiation protein DivIVA
MLQLSELLERLRPAGTPGAPTEGEQQRRHELREHEIATVSSTLRGFEAEAERVVAAGRAEADRLRRDGERRAQLVEAQLPDRIAVARGEAVQHDKERGDGEITTVKHDAERKIARIEADAESRVPQLADAVAATIWSTLETDTTGRP